jgi:MFS family permease
LGGFLTDQISWHWIFFVNLPVGAVALYIIWRLLPAHTESGVTRRIDYLGVFVFTLALVPILIGLTNKQDPALAWTDPWVGGLIVLGLLLGALFIWIESRSPEPIMPLGLFRNRTYSVSLLAGALASFGFFGAVIFLPRWYQVVNGSSATESGYQLLPLLAGVISGSIISGQLVSRTGRYKWLTVGALVTLSIGLFLLTNLRADTPTPVLWTWQFIAGIGIGPTLAVFTIIVQNSVPWQQLGVATSNLAFFRQVGGTVGLSIAGTVFGSTLQTEAPRQVEAALVARGVPQQEIDLFTATFSSSNAFTLDDLSAVGDMGARILAQVPEQFRALVEPLIPDIVFGIHQAFSLAIANTMWLSLIAALVATVTTLALREEPLRTAVHASSMAARRPAPAAPGATTGD